MTTDRITRVNELLKREIGTSLLQVIPDNEVDLSTVTVTAVHAGTNLRTAKVMVSIRDTDVKRREVISALLNHRVALQEIINRNLKLKYTPRLSFELDLSVEKGDHVLKVLYELEREGNTENAGTPEGADE